MLRRAVQELQAAAAAALARSCRCCALPISAECLDFEQCSAPLSGMPLAIIF